MAKKKIDESRIRSENIDTILKGLEANLLLPETAPLETHSLEYRKFREEERNLNTTIYEKLCAIAEKLNIEPDTPRAERIARSMTFSHINATPIGAYSLAVASFAASIILSGLLFVLRFISPSTLFVLVAASFALFYFLYQYPISQAKIYRVKASNEIILAVLYMVIFMRSSPNMEGAVRFAATNLAGPLSLDIKKILWDIETGKYTTLDEALDIYLQSWDENPEFVESVQLIKSSREQIDASRHAMLDEAVNVILNGTTDKMKGYSRMLRMPVLLIHALGVMLPILVLVMFPIIVLFLQDSIKPSHLVLGYDVLLPLFIFLLSKRLLEYRAFGLSSPDITLHPKYAPLGRIRVFGYDMPIWPVGAAVGLVAGTIGLALMGTLKPTEAISFNSMMYSLVITWGIGLSIAVFFIIDTDRKMSIRQDIAKFQDEFAEALFTLGNKMSLGKPIEAAMEDVIVRSKDMAIADMFRKSVKNIKESGMTMESSLFDQTFGAVWEYPSKIIINVMRIILDATRKSTQAASMSALSISKYLKQIHRVEEDLKDMLSEATSSMKFLAMFLAPLIAGVTVTMAAIMMLIFSRLGSSIEVLNQSKVPGFSLGMIGGWGQASKIMPLGNFQIIVGIYMLQIAYLLSLLTSGIEDGPDDIISRRYLSGLSIIIGLFVYTFAMIITYSLFGSQIEGILTAGAIQ
ncbi:MAG: hypothetical protein HZB68_00745 [Candidatus Aenigmarchaeota archaeon]|nr:hypothetical protein [Candidatus Aenigmarchaeota archaeon]